MSLRSATVYGGGLLVPTVEQVRGCRGETLRQVRDSVDFADLAKNGVNVVWSPEQHNAIPGNAQFYESGNCIGQILERWLEVA